MTETTVTAASRWRGRPTPIYNPTRPAVKGHPVGPVVSDWSLHISR